MNIVLLLSVMDILNSTLFGGKMNELILGLKIVILLMIIGFVRSHIENKTLSVIVIAIMAYFVLFYSWAWMGPFYIVYMLITFGAAGILVDFFFIRQSGGHEKPEMAGTDMLMQGARMRRIRR